MDYRQGFEGGSRREVEHVHTLLERREMCDEARQQLRGTLDEHLCLGGLEFGKPLAQMNFHVDFAQTPFEPKHLRTLSLLNREDENCTTCPNAGRCPKEAGKRKYLKERPSLSADQATALAVIKDKSGVPKRHQKVAALLGWVIYAIGDLLSPRRK